MTRASAPAASLVLTDAKVIDGSGAEPIERAELAITHGKIVYCGPARGAAARPEPSVVVDLSGRTVMPGMIDCHIHMAGIGVGEEYAPEKTDTHAVLRAAADMRRTLEAGFTTVRDVGGRNYMEMDLRRAIADGHAVGPRLLLAGKVLSVTSIMANDFIGCMHEADSVPALRHGVRAQLKAGADVIKIVATGVGTGEDPQRPTFTTEELLNVVDVAHSAGYKVAAHAQGIEGVRRAVDAGVDTLEHGCALMDDESVARDMGAKGTFLVPTYSVYKPLMANPALNTGAEYLWKVNRLYIDTKAESIRLAMHYNVPIAMGTDAGSAELPHGINADELRLLVDAGMDPMTAIVSATGNAARALGIDDQTGTLEVGKDADVLVLDADPLENVEVLARQESIYLVARRGRPLAGTLLERPRILSALDEAAIEAPELAAAVQTGGCSAYCDHH